MTTGATFLKIPKLQIRSYFIHETPMLHAEIINDDEKNSISYVMVVEIYEIQALRRNHITVICAYMREKRCRGALWFQLT